MVNVLQGLPPLYLKRGADVSNRVPHQIVLVRPEGNGGGSVGGGYAARNLFVAIPGNYDPSSLFGAGSPPDTYYGNLGGQFRDVIAHELTHSFSESYPNLQIDWNNQLGWKQVNGKWVNDHPNQLPQSYPNIGDKPVEDLAESFGLFFLGSPELSESRKEFFRKNKYYKDWASKNGK